MVGCESNEFSEDIRQSRILQTIYDYIHTELEEYNIPRCAFYHLTYGDSIAVSGHDDKEESDDSRDERHRNLKRFTHKITGEQKRKDQPGPVEEPAVAYRLAGLFKFTDIKVGRQIFSEK